MSITKTHAHAVECGIFHTILSDEGLRWDSWIDFGHLCSISSSSSLFLSISHKLFSTFFFSIIYPHSISLFSSPSPHLLYSLSICPETICLPPPPYPSISLSQHLFPAKIRAAFTSCFLLPIFPSLPLWHSKIYLCALHFLTSLTPHWLISFCRAVSLHLWKPNRFKVLLFYFLITLTKSQYVS